MGYVVAAIFGKYSLSDWVNCGLKGLSTYPDASLVIMVPEPVKVSF